VSENQHVIINHSPKQPSGSGYVWVIIWLSKHTCNMSHDWLIWKQAESF